MTYSSLGPSENVLNGYNEAGAQAAQAVINAQAANTTKTPHKTVKGTSKASSTHKAVTVPKATKAVTVKVTAPVINDIHGIGESTPANTFTESSQLSTYPAGTIDPVFGGIVPVLLLIIVVWLFMKFMSHSIRSNPPHGGFAHKHKRMHPGTPNPRIL